MSGVVKLCHGYISELSPVHRLEADIGAHIRAASYQSSRNPFMLACPFLPTTMWSCTEMPSGEAISMIALVIWMSACDGVGSPEG
jgi:hypothetical protein